MNERIQELKQQALKHPDNDNDGLTVFDDDELKKFTELIVRECASLAYDGPSGILDYFGFENERGIS